LYRAVVVKTLHGTNGNMMVERDIGKDLAQGLRIVSSPLCDIN